MAMNISLLLAVRERILSEPEHYNQSEYCGTRCCIAGHAVRIAGLPVWDRDPEDITNPIIVSKAARWLLGLGESYKKLCSYVEDWPKEFSKKYYAASKYSLGRAQVAAEAIIDFIITDGWTKPADWKALAEVSPELIPVEQETGTERNLTCA